MPRGDYEAAINIVRLSKRLALDEKAWWALRQRAKRG
jgi:hypothetical protein